MSQVINWENIEFLKEDEDYLFPENQNSSTKSSDSNEKLSDKVDNFSEANSSLKDEEKVKVTQKRHSTQRKGEFSAHIYRDDRLTKSAIRGCIFVIKIYFANKINEYK